MNIHQRQYNHSVDYERVGEFLIRHYQPENRDGNWIQPAWEYMHFHPGLDQSALDKIGIWEAQGEIAAVTHYESRLGEAFFEFHHAYKALRSQLLDYAEGNLFGFKQAEGRKYLCAYINDFDEPFKADALRRGYERQPDWQRPMARFHIPLEFPEIRLAPGFRLQSLADEPDWSKVHRVMWRGFDHEGEPPGGDEELESRRTMFDTSSARRELKIVAVAPNGEFAAICGMFYEPVNRYAYVEPVATDPSFRRLGLGKAVVLEGIRRCARLGAQVAFVASDQEFYRAIGFEVLGASEAWVKLLD